MKPQSCDSVRTFGAASPGDRPSAARRVSGAVMLVQEDELKLTWHMAHSRGPRSWERLV